MDDDKLYQSLVNASLRFVSFRPRSRKEIVNFLRKKLVKWKKDGTQTLERVLVRFEELGYVDDRTFASWWVEQRNSFRPKGALLIARELSAKGVDRDVIEEALARSEGNEAGAAKAVVQKKMKLLQSLPKRELQQKLYGYLGRRGFSADTISHVVDDVLGNDV